MMNPLSMKPSAPAVPQGTFGNAFIKGAKSGALMMSIFSGLMFVGSLIPIPGNPLHFAWLTAAVTTGLGTLATGLFSGVTATQRAAAEANSAAHASHPATHHAREPISRAPEHAATRDLSTASHNSRAWTERVSAERGSSRDHISSILADRSMSSGARADAILREREQSNTSAIQH